MRKPLTAVVMAAVFALSAKPGLSPPPLPTERIPGTNYVEITERILDPLITERVEQFGERVRTTVEFWTPGGDLKERLSDDHPLSKQGSMYVDPQNRLVVRYDYPHRQAQVRFFHNPRKLTVPTGSMRATPDGRLLVRENETSDRRVIATTWTFYPEGRPARTVGPYRALVTVLDSQGYLASFAFPIQPGKSTASLLLVVRPDGTKAWSEPLDSRSVHDLWPAPDGRGVLVNLAGIPPDVSRFAYYRPGKAPKEVISFRHGNARTVVWLPNSPRVVIGTGYPQYELLMLDCESGKVVWSRKQDGDPHVSQAAVVPAAEWGGNFPLLFQVLPSERHQKQGAAFICLRADAGQELGTWEAYVYSPSGPLPYGRFYQEKGRLWYVSEHAAKEINVKAAAAGRSDSRGYM